MTRRLQVQLIYIPASTRVLNKRTCFHALSVSLCVFQIKEYFIFTSNHLLTHCIFFSVQSLGTTLPEGGPLVLPALTSDDLELHQLGCDDHNYMCVRFGRGSATEPVYTFEVESGRDDSLITCKELDCAGIYMTQERTFFFFFPLTPTVTKWRHPFVSSVMPLSLVYVTFCLCINCKIMVLVLLMTVLYNNIAFSSVVIMLLYFVYQSKAETPKHLVSLLVPLASRYIVEGKSLPFFIYFFLFNFFFVAYEIIIFCSSYEIVIIIIFCSSNDNHIMIQ